MEYDLKLSLIPREAYRFWPSQSISNRHSGRFYQRMIFKRQEFSDSEEEILADLYSALDKDSKLSRQIHKKIDKPDLLRLIYSAEWDIAAAIDRLQKYIDWHDQVLTPIRQLPESTFLPVLVVFTQSSGGCYTHGRDCFYRPLLILVPGRLARFGAAEVLAAVTFLLDFMETYMLLPGQIENWVMLLDMEQSQSVPQMSMSVGYIQGMKAQLEPFLIAFASRLAAGFIWHVNRSLWERLTALLSPETSGKFTLVSDSSGASQLFKLVNRTQLEAKFGGLAGEKTAFWPPEVAGRGVYSTDTAVVLSDYSSFQEYFPERSMSYGDSTPFSFSDEEDGQNQVKSVLVSSWPMNEIAETEEGPTVTRPVRVNRLSVDLMHSAKPKIRSPVRRPIISVEATESEGLGCYCFSNRSSSNCSLM